MEHLNQRASVTEITELGNNICAAIVAAAIVDMYLNSQHPKLKALVDRMTAGLALPKTKSLRDLLEQADELRDSLLSVVYFFLRGYLAWDHEETNEAAQMVNKIMKAHGTGIAKFSYEKESALLNSLLLEFEKAEVAQALALLNLTAPVAELKAAQENFTNLYRQAVILDANKTEILAPTSLRKETLQCMYDLTDYLTLMSKSNEAVYGKLVSELTVLVDQMNVKIATRQTRRENTENEETIAKA